MSRTLFRSAAPALRGAIVPPSIRLATPLLARAFNTTAPIVEPVPPEQQHINNAANPTAHHVRPLAFKKSHPAPPPAPIEDSVRNLLPFLAAQPGHYITVHIHGFPYLVQEGDEIRLPFRMPGVLPGDLLRLNRASVIGSRDYTMKGAPHIDERVFECRATVTGTESEPLRIKIKKKRRQRRARRVHSKHRYTILRISELNIKNADNVEL
ncbi:ribosomal protein L21-like protein [Emericellopsis atlantica]|uniref:Large ribosomal subunit protein bL21m n=1 Tax=Emericellopsis atlantica TaxID=2614577 RepID=A0A9P8CRI7_9HYPO|nr:ribosomal protein L21-like protein [Emericellopsis atlantica]KAG9257069.1 ribosomal protein L21-like protein [Emericellopsis atlantica]